MKLRYSIGSPFARKAVLAARLCGLQERIAFVESADDPGDALRAANPLNKIPLLVLDDGEALFDSPVILQYFDWLAGGGRIFPTDGAARFRALRDEALADGLAEAAVLIRAEGRWREPSQISERWIAHQRSKISRALAVFEGRRPAASPLGADGIALVCALEYIDRAFGPDWRAQAPGCADWFDRLERENAHVAQTRPPR